MKPQKTYSEPQQKVVSKQKELKLKVLFKIKNRTTLVSNFKLQDKSWTTLTSLK
jgi:hypothetical protein